MRLLRTTHVRALVAVGAFSILAMAMVIPAMAGADPAQGGAAPGGGAAGDHTLASVNTNTSAEVVAIQHTTSGTAAAGFGGHVAFYLENDGGDLAEAGRLGMEWTGAVAGSESSKLSLFLSDTGSVVSVLTVDYGGAINLPIGGSITATTGDLYLNATTGTVIIGDSSTAIDLTAPTSAWGSELTGWKYDVEAHTEGSGAPHALGNDNDMASVFTNEGTGAANYHTLPTAAAGYNFTFAVQDANGLRVVANTDDTIRIGQNVTAAAGYVESTVVGSYLTLVAINATEWLATSYYGPWTDGTFVSHYQTAPASQSVTCSWSSATVTAYSWRDGSKLRIRGGIDTGSPTGGDPLTLSITLPQAFDTTRNSPHTVASGVTNQVVLGTCMAWDAAAVVRPGICRYDNGTVSFLIYNSGTGATVTKTTPWTFAAADSVQFDIEYVVSGW